MAVLQKMLITGGCGFVGQQLVKLASERYEVHIVDNLHSGEYRLKSMNLTKNRLHRLDLRDADKLQALISKIAPDIVTHLAAIHFIPECENNPDLAVSTNVLGTINLLKAIPDKCRFVYTSSAAVYAPKPTILKESDPLGPMEVYGYTKLHGEVYTRYFSRLKSLRTSIVRLFNVIGPGETNPHVVPEIMIQIKNGAKILRLGDISAQRDFIAVSDAADGFLRIAEFMPDELHITNLGTSYTHSINDVLALIREIMNVEFQVETDPARLRESDRPILRSSIKRLKESLSWVPEKSIRHSIEELCNSADYAPYKTAGR